MWLGLKVKETDTFHSMTSKPSALKRAIVALLVAVPLLGGATFSTLAGIDPADAWSATDNREGAPAVIDDSLLIDARRATGEANSQAGFLVNGTKQLTEGTKKISGRSGEVTGAVTAATDGSKKLSDGLVELQAATGQLGDGATKVADGVETAVNQLVTFEVVRGQIVGTIDRYLDDLKGATDADSVELREQLTGFREQASSFQLDEGTRKQLEELRDGSREIANQLHVPGYAYHDGIFSATKGAKELHDGLNQLNAGVDEALAGVGELESGAVKIDDMAKLTKEKISAIQRAMPITQAGTPEAEAAGVTRTFAPMYAFLISAGVLLGAALHRRGDREQWWLSALVVLGLGGMATILSVILGSGIEAVQILGITGLAVLLAASALIGGMLLCRILGPRIGTVAAILGSLAQVGIVGWAWNSATTSAVDTAWLALSSLTPVHYSTAGLAALGNSGGVSTMVGISYGVLLLLVVAGVIGLKLLPATDIEQAPAWEGDYSEEFFDEYDDGADVVDADDEYIDGEYADGEYIDDQSYRDKTN